MFKVPDTFWLYHAGKLSGVKNILNDNQIYIRLLSLDFKHIVLCVLCANDLKVSRISGLSVFLLVLLSTYFVYKISGCPSVKFDIRS